MRTKQLLLAALALLALAATSCKKEEPVEDNLSLSPTSLTFAATGGEQIVTVTANLEWTPKSDAAWLTVLPANDGKTFKVTAAENTGTSARTATITVSTKSKKATVSVTQDGKAEETLSVSPTSLSFKNEGGAETVTVTASTSWNAVSDAAWLTINPANDGKTFKATAAKNEAAAGKAAPERKANIKVTAGSKEVTIVAVQSAETVVFKLEGDTTPAEFPAEGGSLKVAVSYNTESYEVIIPAEATWITKADTKAVLTENLTFTVAANDGAAREAEIAFAPKTGDAQKITVKQAAKPAGDKGIKTAEELLAWLADPKESAKILNDIDLAGATVVPDTLQVGIVLDGQGYKIKNWTSEGPLVNQNLGTVKNIVLDASCKLTTIPKGNSCFVVLENRGTVEGCINNADVNVVDIAGTSNIGAIVGKMNTNPSAIIKNCVNNGKFIVPSAGLAIGGQPLMGGVVGRVDAGTVDGCSNTGTLSITVDGNTSNHFYLGGVVGFFSNDASGSPVLIKNCTNSGTIEYLSSKTVNKIISLGGVIGATKANADQAFVNYGTVKDCTNTGKVNLCYFSTNYSNVGGVIGYLEGNIEGCKNSGVIKNESTHDKTSSGGPGVGGVAGRVLYSAKDCSNSGDVTLKGIRAAATANKAFMGFSEAPSIGGVFGQIGGTEGAKMDNCSNTGTIHAPVRMGASNATATYMGAVVGNAKADITNCTNTGNVTIEDNQHKSQRLGGIVGNLAGGSIAGSVNKGNITFNGITTTDGACSTSSGNQCYVGGIVGMASVDGTTVKNCTNEGTIKFGSARNAAFNYFGGIAGQHKATLDGCTNKGAVISEAAGKVRIAGISANPQRAATNCINNGDVTMKNALSPDENNFSVAAGLFGHIENSAYTGCQNTGKVTVVESAGNKNCASLAIGSVGNTANTIDDFTLGGEVVAPDSYAGSIVGGQILDLTKQIATITCTVGGTKEVTVTGKINGKAATAETVCGYWEPALEGGTVTGKDAFVLANVKF